MCPHDEIDEETMLQALDVLDALFEDLALAAADDPDAASEEDKQWAEDMLARMRQRIAAARRNLLPKIVPVSVAPDIHDSLLAAPRYQLVSMLDELERWIGPNVRLADSRLEALSDDDLRRLVVTLDTDRRVS